MSDLKAQEIFQAERERRKNNLHKVYNPTDKDFKVVFNATVSPEVWTIKAHSEEIVPEFVARKYIKDMFNLITTSKVDELTRIENERREKAGIQKMNDYDERFRFESRNSKLTEEQTKTIMRQLYKGLYKEYGIDAEPVTEPLITPSSKPVFDKALEDVFKETPAIEEDIVKEPLRDGFRILDDEPAKKVKKAIKEISK